ncbi:MAG: phytoene/squalene synthase family protein [Candidatus Thermoplasmatota archaeon]
MIVDKTFIAIFQKGSRTYFYSSLFFPMHIRRDVFILYGFVRKADNFVDAVPQNPQGFYEFKEKYKQAVAGQQTGDIVIDSFVDLAHKHNFNFEWVDSFLHSMEMDLTKKTYETMEETIDYMYGSAEVIGLLMARILHLNDDALPYAQYLGRAMQYINFIRDIDEDNALGRIYFPRSELQKYGLENLNYDHVFTHQQGFYDFIHAQIQKYCEWQEFAEQGYSRIPKRYLISVKTASEMYKWTAQKILHNPFIVYDWKVKPRIIRIVTATLVNLINIMSDKYETTPCPVKQHHH